MCGIVGLYLKNDELKPRLGEMFAPMLIEMTDRGPDSAGIAVFRNPEFEGVKITAFSPYPDFNWEKVCEGIRNELGANAKCEANDSHQVIVTDAEPTRAVELIEKSGESIQIMSVGSTMEIYKETGRPREVVNRFAVEGMSGSHIVGHTRMATESAVTTAGSHPFSTGTDICLVHNGSLSNHNRLRQRLIRQKGMQFKTENDTEVAAAYLTHRLDCGRSLFESLEDCIEELDGFYTLLVGTKDGFAALRDPIACKPAVLAETEDYVAFGSEYRALAELPGIGLANVWEPEPSIVYSWGAS